MRVPIAAAAGGTAALVAASMLGGAAAETTGGGAPVRTVAVGGVASAPLAQGASAASATAVYRQALAAAITDGQAKAEFLAGKVGATLGAAQSVAEGGGSISCTGEPGSEGTRYVAYEGEEPDFPAGGFVPGVGPVAAAAPAVGAPVPRKLRRRRHRTTAHRAAAVTCTLQAHVSLSYQLG